MEQSNFKVIWLIGYQGEGIFVAELKEESFAYEDFTIKRVTDSDLSKLVAELKENTRKTIEAFDLQGKIWKDTLISFEFTQIAIEYIQASLTEGLVLRKYTGCTTMILLTLAFIYVCKLLWSWIAPLLMLWIAPLIH